jgi:hypothetical protein
MISPWPGSAHAALDNGMGILEVTLGLILAWISMAQLAVESSKAAMDNVRIRLIDSKLGSHATPGGIRDGCVRHWQGEAFRHCQSIVYRGL